MSRSWNTPFSEIPHTLVDVETTGLDPNIGHRVCEIALVRYTATDAPRTFTTLVNPGRSISPGAMAVHGITYEMLRDAPPFADIAGEVLDHFLVQLAERGIVTLGQLLEAQGGTISSPRPETIPLPPQIEDALARGGAVFLRYLSEGGGESERWVEPIRVTRAHGQTYLIAHCRLRGDQRTFRLDRILEIRSESARPRPPV